MACYRCGARQTDPVKGKSPWARFVHRGEQVLICPNCQRELGRWQAEADACPSCSSTRLVVIMDRVVCKECGKDYDRSEVQQAESR